MGTRTSVIDCWSPLIHVIEDNQLGKEDAGGLGKDFHPERHGCMIELSVVEDRPMLTGCAQTVTARGMTNEQQIVIIATDAFDDEQLAQAWLHEPNIRTGGRSPIELINTPDGFQAVETVLNQIKYSVFA